MKESRKMNLDNRLFLCAQTVRPGKKVADVGSDHAYLAIWLVLNNISNCVLATDVREGPLLNAKKNILKYNVENRVKVRLSDGLNEVYADEVDDIVLAGMGGELIAKIIKRAAWLKDKSKHLILQPMSAEKELREFLASEGFKIVEENAVISCGKVYTVMSVGYDGVLTEFNELYPYIGALSENLTPEACIYVEKTIRDLKNKLKGCVCLNDLEKTKDLQTIILELERLLEGKKYD